MSAFWQHPERAAREILWIVGSVALVVLLLSVIHYVVDLYLDSDEDARWRKPLGWGLRRN